MVGPSFRRTSSIGSDANRKNMTDLENYLAFRLASLFAITSIVDSRSSRFFPDRIKTKVAVEATEKLHVGCAGKAWRRTHGGRPACKVKVRSCGKNGKGGMDCEWRRVSIRTIFIDKKRGSSLLKNTIYKKRKIEPVAMSNSTQQNAFNIVSECGVEF